MRIGILIQDTEYRDALVERLSYYDNDLFVNVIGKSDTISKDCLILTDLSPESIDKETLSKIINRTVFLITSEKADTEFAECNKVFKYSSVSSLLSELSVVYSEWHGSGYGRDYSAKMIAAFSDNDSVSYDKCMGLARQIVYRRGCKVLVAALGYINDYGSDDAGRVNRFARLMYAITSGRASAANGYTYTDSYDVAALLLQKGSNPLAYLGEAELVSVASSLASGYDTVILDIGTCYRRENLTIAENADIIIFFENGRRVTGLETLLSEDALNRMIRIRSGGGSEEAMATDDAINRIFGAEEHENNKN